MPTTLTVASEYMNVLQALGNAEDMVKAAIRSYAIEHIGERIGALQHELLALQQQYGSPYEKFYVRVTTDEAFVTRLRQAHPTWERDLQTWEYYQEELSEWLGHLERISKAS